MMDLYKSSLSPKARRASDNAALRDMLRKQGDPREPGARSLRDYIADVLFAARAVHRGGGGPAAPLMRNGQQASGRLAARANDGSVEAGVTSTSLRKHIHASVISIAALLGGVGGWAATAEFSGAVIVPGTLVVDGSIKKLQHPTGGVVSEVLVKEGDHVAAGDVLIRLDHVQASVNLQIVAKNLNELLVRRVRLEAENLGAQTLEFQSDLSERALDDPELGRVIAGERSLFLARSDSRQGQRSQLKERIRQLHGQTSGLEEQIVAKKKEMQLIARELSGVQELYAKSLIPLQRVTILERDSARIEGEHGAMIAQIAQTGARVTETELQILQIEQDLRTEVGRELADVRAKIAEMSERKVSADDQLRRVELRAPLSGVVHQLAVHTIGGVIGAGEVLLQLVPDTEELGVEVRLPPDRIDQVRAGQPAILRFSAFDHRTTPEILGEVKRVSADLVMDHRTGSAYYSSLIKFPSSEAARLKEKLLPGMPVEAFIKTGERTVLTYLTKPLGDQMRRSFRER